MALINYNKYLTKNKPYIILSKLTTQDDANKVTEIGSN